MRCLILRIALAGCLGLAGAAPVGAGGFSIYEASARATGMGCAVTASVDDGSAPFYNVAALGFMAPTVIDANLMPVMPRMRFRQATPPVPAATGETVTQSFPIPGGGAVFNPAGKLAYGLGFYAPFGLGVEWRDPQAWTGRFTSYDVDLATIYVIPAVCYRISDHLTVGLGADIAWQQIELNRFKGLAFGGHNELVNVVDVRLQGSSKLNVTPSAGMMYRPNGRWSLGLMYHHHKTMRYRNQDGELSNIAPDALIAAVDQTLDELAGAPGRRTYRLATDLELPHILSLGAACRVHPRLLIEVDAVHFGWSRFAELDLRFSPDPTGSLSTVIPEHYEDRWQWRLGLDFDLAPRWKLLAGYARDRTPQPRASMGPLLPDSDRHDWSGGVQYRHGPWRLTASYMLVHNEERNNLENGGPAIFADERDDPQAVILKTMEAGTYRSLAHILAFGVGYHH
ncbi:MAG: outer membrane protein transport protein [Candidatus Krumholzibacteria bacterium]|nr:outer membrane protein transport protein [Candidatus Krumholzibacteria bacterium]